MSSHIPAARIAQRQPLACMACSRRKVKCDKQVPCSRCIRAGIECERERVLVSNVITKHGEELSFLRKLEKKLRSPRVTIEDIADDISTRIRALELGNSGTKANFPRSAQRDEWALERPYHSKAVANPASEFNNKSSNHTSAFASPITLESLAWGRHYGGCYPHRRCDCFGYRSSSEMTSVRCNSLHLTRWYSNSMNLGSSSAQLLSLPSSMKLVKFHISHLAWHHGVLHTPTFLEQCEAFWSTNKLPHPLWMALYLSVLSSTSWSIQNSSKIQEELGISIAEDAPEQLFRATVEVLYGEKFLEQISMYSVQAILISTEVTANLGLSDLNATLLAAAIRLSQCMGLHKITEPPLIEMQMQESERWYEAIEREVGKRIWCQLVIQDHFGLCFTDSYNINPKHCLTEPPKNCDDHDLEEHDNKVPTVTTYVRTLSHLATLVPRLFDELGPLWSRKPIREQYEDVLRGDRDMRRLVADIPFFLLREGMSQQIVDKPWLDVARRSIAIIVAEKIILIHRPFLFASFQTPYYPHTRSTCVSAATTIAREYANIVVDDHISLWEHSAYCVTASIILCLHLLYPQKALSSQRGQDALEFPGADQRFHDLVNSTRERLANRSGDILAHRGVQLIDTMLSVGTTNEHNKEHTQTPIRGDLNRDDFHNPELDIQKIVSEFFAGDAIHMGASWEGWDSSLNTEPSLDIELVGADFDAWFAETFGV